MGIRLAEQYSVDVVLNCHSCEAEPQLINPSAFGYPAYVERVQRAVDAVNAAFCAVGLRHAPVPPAATSRVFNLNELFTLASGALCLTLECSVWSGLSFDQLLAVNYVTVESLLKDGQREPLAMRRQLLS